MGRVVAWAVRIWVAAALAAAAAGFAHAGGDGDDDGDHRHETAERASRSAESGEFVPLASIVAAVRARFPGEIVATEFETRDGRPAYEFHLLSEDGRVTEVRVDARTGRILGGEGDDD
jgi:uncharacterized membrane protein YkoI